MSDTDMHLDRLYGYQYSSTATERRQRFAVDSKGNIIATNWPSGLLLINGQTHVCSSLPFPSGQDENPCDVICETLDFSIVNAVFGSSDDAPSECLWLLYESFVCLYRMENKRIAFVTKKPSSGSSHNRDFDGFALPAKRISTPATISNAFTFTRLKRPALVILGGGNVRMLDMVTWEITTIASSVPSSLLMYPGFLSAGPSSTFVPSDDHVLLDHQRIIAHVDLASGKMVKGPKHQPGRQSEEFLPIPSSTDAPTYLVRCKGHSTLMRFWKDQIETAQIVLERGSSIAHSASSNLTVLVSSLEDRKYIFSKCLGWKVIQSSERLPIFDFSSLLSNDFFPHDLVLKIESKSIKVPYNILRNLYPALEKALLVKVVKKFPDASVDAFIRYLLGGPMISDTKESHMIWSHSIAMFDALGLENNLPLETFVFSILPKLTTSEACSLLCDVWNDSHTIWTRADPLIEALALHVGETCFDEFMALLIANPSSRNMELSFAVHSIKGTKPTLVRSELSAPRGLRAVQIFEADCTLTQPCLLLNGPNEFVFVLNLPHRRLGMVGDIWYLYTRWAWFKRLVEFGGAEKQTRVAEMPGWMNPVDLGAILGCVHGVRYDGPLDRPAALNLLEHRHEMELVDRDGNPHPTFAELHNACMKLLFPIIRLENVLDQVSSYHRIGEMAKVKELLTAIVSGTYDLPAMKLFDELSAELLVLLKEVRGNWKQSNNGAGPRIVGWFQPGKFKR